MTNKTNDLGTFVCEVKNCTREAALTQILDSHVFVIWCPLCVQEFTRHHTVIQVLHSLRVSKAHGDWASVYAYEADLRSLCDSWEKGGLRPEKDHK